MVTLSGAEYVIPRSWHSFTSYLSCIATGSPHLLQKVGVFLLNVPHLWQTTSPVWYGLVSTDAPQLRQEGRRVSQSLQVAALTLPVSDGIVYEFELRHFTEVANRKHGGKHGLKAAVVALARQQIHLQKALVRLHLDFDQIRDLDGSLNLGKIQSLAFSNVLVAMRRHSGCTSFPFGQAAENSGKTLNRVAVRLAQSRAAHGK